ncbi:Bacterial extracellular solute-binding proteins, family 3 [Vibrio aerogenes CECT 7868]|uniref:Bacterial extracellular solute-binding proteins, family 3 n=1 Tax=Vibrio aerogenes CECT 7868 TaxID=1216006 RepID=A0A1M5ZX28_9VIBR|nr:transporter substrate-binding domain-containing protein [Vibrio aerogenes]SHI28706.1 Bacterial extracellular solute-binding proteins, family 3 [Vibrio aerogenes CECT 7868]
MNFINPILLLISILSASMTVFARDPPQITLDIACSMYYPYVYQQDEQIKGKFYEIAELVANQANIPFRYRLLPWARVFNYGLTKENFLVGCLGRTLKREQLFYWIGPLTSRVDVHFYQHASSDAKIRILSDLKAYKIAVQRQSFYEDFLIAMNFPPESIQAVTSQEQLFLLLVEKRVDFFLIDDITFANMPARLHISPDLFKKSLFAFSMQEYLALSKKTSKTIYERLSAAYKELESNGQLRHLISHPE